MTEPVGPPVSPPTPPPTEPPQPSGAAGNPWERRASLGGVNAFIEAVKLFATSPGEAFSQTHKRGDYGSPLLFAILVGWIGVTIGQIWQTLMGASFLSMMPAEFRGSIPFVAGSAGGFLLNVIFAPVYIIIGLFVWGALLHLCLVIVGGLGKSQAGFEGSFRVIAYSMVAQLANLIPIAGGMICLVWTLVLAVIGVQKLHETEQGKAVAAVLIPVALCCACIALSIFVMGASLMTFFANR